MIGAAPPRILARPHGFITQHVARKEGEEKVQKVPVFYKRLFGVEEDSSYEFVFRGVLFAPDDMNDATQAFMKTMLACFPKESRAMQTERSRVLVPFKLNGADKIALVSLQVLPLSGAIELLRNGDASEPERPQPEMESPKRPGQRKVRRRFSPIRGLPMPEGGNAAKSTFFMSGMTPGSEASIEKIVVLEDFYSGSSGRTQISRHLLCFQTDGIEDVQPEGPFDEVYVVCPTSAEGCEELLANICTRLGRRLEEPETPFAAGDTTPGRAAEARGARFQRLDSSLGGSTEATPLLPRGPPPPAASAPPAPANNLLMISLGDLKFVLPPPQATACWNLCVERGIKMACFGQRLTVLNVGHNGTCLLCPENDLAQGVVQYSVNAAGPEPMQSAMYWMPAEEFHALANGNEHPQVARPAFNAQIPPPELFRSIPFPEERPTLEVLDAVEDVSALVPA
jgi:hypothetical protein